MKAATTDIEPLTLLQKKQLDFEDGRVRFQEIFCAILNHHGQTLPDYKTCDKALNYMAKEGDKEHPDNVIPVNLDASQNNYLIGLVPGLGWQCVRWWMDNDNSGIQHILKQGYDARLFVVDGLSSSENNAAQLKNYISALTEEEQQRPLILIGYSKGIVDVLQAIIQYPELRKRTVAVVGVAGAVRGSPLADSTPQSRLNLLTYIPKSGCESGDKGALESLRPDTRRQWLAANPLPDNIRFYSVIAAPQPEQISFGLQHTYKKLGGVDAINDGQIIFYDQLIPGSTLLAFVNADHWAMSIPVARQIKLNRLTFASKNEYPREALLEAILRYIEEDLQD